MLLRIDGECQLLTRGFDVTFLGIELGEVKMGVRQVRQLYRLLETLSRALLIGFGNVDAANQVPKRRLQKLMFSSLLSGV